MSVCLNCSMQFEIPVNIVAPVAGILTLRKIEDNNEHQVHEKHQRYAEYQQRSLAGRVPFSINQLEFESMPLI